MKFSKSFENSFIFLIFELKQYNCTMWLYSNAKVLSAKALKNALTDAILEICVPSSS